MLAITSELNEFITVLYGRQPTMNTTWVQLYADACKQITKDVYRFYMASVKTAVPCNQSHILSFLIYEERIHINNAKFIQPMSPEQAMRLLQISAVIRTKLQEIYHLKQKGRD